jgi:hypothetical protein
MGRALLTIGILFLALWGSAASAQAPRSIATVSALVGDCAVTRFGASGATPLAVGSALHEGDQVRTAAGARLKLEFGDGTVIQLGENTDLALEWYLYAPEAESQNVLLRVSSGIFRVILDFVLPNAAFEVQTATAAATVRGTEWITEANGDSTAIVALEGTVAVRNVRPGVPGQVLLEPGEGTDVAAGAAPSGPVVWGDARREDFIARTTLP